MTEKRNYRAGIYSTSVPCAGLLWCWQLVKWWLASQGSWAGPLLSKNEMVRCPRSSCAQNWNEQVSFVRMTLCCPEMWHMSPNRLFSISFETKSPNLFFNDISTCSHRSFSIWSRKKSIWAKTLARCPVTGISRTWVLRGDFDYLLEPQIQKWSHHWKSYDL